MAGSRLEKIGSIFSRTSGLLKSGALKMEDKPLWYDVYASFPPIDEPRFDRPAPNVPVRQIFYEEDRIRARFHKYQKNVGTINLSDQKYRTQTQQFIDAYRKIQEQGALDENQIFEAALDVVNEKLSREYDSQPRESFGLLNNFTEAKATAAAGGGDGDNNKSTTNIDIKNIFKD